MQNSFSREKPVFAGFWVRLAACLTDQLLILAGLLLIRLLFGRIISFLDSTWLGEGILFQYTWKDICSYLAGAGYFILCTYFTGATVGKRLFNLRVAPAGDSRFTVTDIVYRETVGKFLSGIFLCAGYLMAGLDKEKRGLHDILCDTRVIYEKKVRQTIVPPVRGEDFYFQEGQYHFRQPGNLPLEEERKGQE